MARRIADQCRAVAIQSHSGELQPGVRRWLPRHSAGLTSIRLPSALSIRVLRSISFCRFLAVARSPSRTALKILRRSRRTCSSWRRQSTFSQASHRTRAGPQVRSPKCSTCPSVPASASASLQRLTCSHQRPFGLRAPGPVYGRLCEHHPGRRPGPRYPLSRCLSAAGIGFLSTLSRHGIPPPYGRPTAAPARRTLASRVGLGPGSGISTGPFNRGRCPNPACPLLSTGLSASPVGCRGVGPHAVLGHGLGICCPR
jgi:hypothetical protein